MLALMASPELPPATSYAVVLPSSPVRLSVLRDPLVSRRAQAGTDVGRTVFWAALARASRAAVFFRAGPAVVVRFSIFVLFILFTDLSTYSKMCIS